VSSLGFGAVRRAAAELSNAYRESRLPNLSTPESITAYLATRMPATYAAAETVLREVAQRVNAGQPTLLDVGAGPGAAALAAGSHFALTQTTLIERDPGMAAVARGFLPEAEISIHDFTRIPLPPHDLVIAAYSLGETASPEAAMKLWQAARLALIVLEPGTPKGFAFLREVRTRLLEAGAHMIAPCPGPSACPLADPDWCHFAARVERTSLHRRLKEAELNYEDEKFAYIAVGRQPALPAESRILRRPHHQPGLIALETCTPQGLKTIKIPKRERDQFRAARRAAWGDAWLPPPL